MCVCVCVSGEQTGVRREGGRGQVNEGPNEGVRKKLGNWRQEGGGKDCRCVEEEEEDRWKRTLKSELRMGTRRRCEGELEQV